MWIYANNKDKIRLNSSPQNSKAQKSLLMNDNSVFWRGFKYKMFSRPYAVIYPRNLKYSPLSFLVSHSSGMMTFFFNSLSALF